MASKGMKRSLENADVPGKNKKKLKLGTKKIKQNDHAADRTNSDELEKDRLGFNEGLGDSSEIDSQDDNEKGKNHDKPNEQVDDNEDLDQKRARLAKEYLEKLTEYYREHASNSDDEEGVKMAIGGRLREEAVEAMTGRRPFRRISTQLEGKTIESVDVKFVRGHQLSVTCVAITDDEATFFSSSKDCKVVHWDIQAAKKLHTFKGGRKRPDLGGHTHQILCMAVTSDGTMLATGSMDKTIKVWDINERKLLETFSGHRDIVTGVAFRVGTHQLFSASNDRTVKIWNCDEMAFVETLFGHQSYITGIDSLTRERCITSSDDKTVRIWKVVEETQLVFRGPTSSIECVSLMNEEFFVSGCQDGSLQLWSANKKKPLVSVPLAHGTSSSAPNWITAVSALKYSDVIASGSCDGNIRLWRADATLKTITPLLTIPCTGFVNSLSFSRSGRYLVAGVGQEHRFGRWWRLQEARNGILIIRLPVKTEAPLLTQ